MFVGHYAASLFARRFCKTAPLGTLFLAAQLTDVVWGILVILHIEHPRLVQAGLGFAGLRLDSMPYSHSMVATVFWAVAALLVVRFLPRLRRIRSVAFIVAVLVLSHWILDLIVHRKDLPIYDSVEFQGLKLWDQHPVLANVIEVGLLSLAFAVYWWLGGGQGKGQPKRVLSFGAILVVVQIVMSVLLLRSVPPFSLPDSDESAARLLAGSALGFYLFCAWWASRLEPPKPLS